MASDKAVENRLRRKAARLGYLLHKDRARTWGINRQGGYMLVDAPTNSVVSGPDFELTLAEVDAWLDEEENRLRAATSSR